MIRVPDSRAAGPTFRTCGDGAAAGRNRPDVATATETRPTAMARRPAVLYDRPASTGRPARQLQALSPVLRAARRPAPRPRAGPPSVCAAPASGAPPGSPSATPAATVRRGPAEPWAEAAQEVLPPGREHGRQFDAVRMIGPSPVTAMVCSA